jgi:hypothetical protein
MYTDSRPNTAPCVGTDADSKPGLEFAVFPDDFFAACAGIGALTTRRAERHADLILIEPERNLPCADKFPFGRGVRIEEGFLIADALAGGRASADQGDGKGTDAVGYFHDRRVLNDAESNLRNSFYRVDVLAPA